LEASSFLLKTAGSELLFLPKDQVQALIDYIEGFKLIDNLWGFVSSLEFLHETLERKLRLMDTLYDEYPKARKDANKLLALLGSDTIKNTSFDDDTRSDHDRLLDSLAQKLAGRPLRQSHSAYR